MRTVGDVYASSLKIDLPFLVGQAFEESGPEYIKIQQEQMFAGERADGTPIFNVKTGSEYYSDWYARYKGKDHPIDLKDTGAFYGGMETRLESEGLFIDSSDSKSDHLKETYEPFLLNDASKIQFMPFAGNKLVEKVIIEINEPA